jgi:hypothetical protein
LMSPRTGAGDDFTLPGHFDPFLRFISFPLFLLLFFLSGPWTAWHSSHFLKYLIISPLLFSLNSAPTPLLPRRLPRRPTLHPFPTHVLDSAEDARTVKEAGLGGVVAMQSWV